MAEVKGRLEKGSGGDRTQQLQRQALASLDEVLEDLEAQQAKAPNKQQAGLIAELRLVRAMQQRVNARTKLYGKGGGAELRALSDRQEKIRQITHDLATPNR
jgi:hypothetical protein